MNVEQIEAQSRRRTRILRAGILAAIVILILGNVFAASITVNSGNPLTFGQGQANVTACDDSVTYSVGSEFSNGTFVVKEVVATIDASACEGKNVIIIPFKEINSTSTTALDAATISLVGITSSSATTKFTVATGTDTTQLNSGISASNVSGVALEIKD